MTSPVNSHAKRKDPAVRHEPYCVSEHHQAYVPSSLEKRLTWDDNVYGDFTVCPFSPSRPSRMQFVCIEAASRLTLERRARILVHPDDDGQGALLSGTTSLIPPGATSDNPPEGPPALGGAPE